MALVGIRASMGAAVLTVAGVNMYNTVRAQQQASAAVAEAVARQDALRDALERNRAQRQQRGGGSGADEELNRMLLDADAAATREGLEALRAALDAADAKRPPPLLQVPLLGAHESVDCVMLAALLLWGEPHTYTVHAAEPFLRSQLGMPAPPTGLLDVCALSRCALGGRCSGTHAP
jgi:hypothetical protein